MSSDPKQGPPYPTQGPPYPMPGYPPQGESYPLHGGPYPQGSAGYPNQAPYSPPKSGYPGQPGGGGGGYYPPPSQGGYIPQEQGYAHVDPEDPNKVFSFDDASIRRSFIRKVYSILMVQLAITFSIMCIFVSYLPLREFSERNPGLLIFSMIMMFVCCIVLACCESVRRTSPTNYIFLGILTLSMAFLLGSVATQYSSNSILFAVGITAVVVLSLTLFAFQTKYDFTVMGGMLLVAMVVLMLFGILCMFYRNNVLQLIYASVSALLFSFYIIYDTQILMGGKHKYSISPEEYVFAALNLYLDIINLFLIILQLIGNSRD